MKKDLIRRTIFARSGISNLYPTLGDWRALIYQIAMGLLTMLGVPGLTSDRG